MSDNTTDILKIEGDLFPFYILHPDAEIPDEWIKGRGSHFFQQGEDVFKLQNTALHSVIRSVDDSAKIAQDFYKDKFYDPNLVYMVAARWKEFNFPIDEFKYAMKYFQWVYDVHKSEAALLLLVHPKKKEWKLQLVVQGGASGASVSYAQPVDLNEIDTSDRLLNAIRKDQEGKELHEAVRKEYNDLFNDGWFIYGTIHSHCNFSAFHSGVDDEDEANFDGLHITIGNVRSGWSYSARLMIGGVEFKQDMSDILGLESMDEISDVDDIEISDFHKSLMIPDLISRNTPKPKVIKQSKNISHQRNHQMVQHFRDQNTYDFRENLYDIENLENDSDWSEYKYNVWNATECTVIFNPQSGKLLIVRDEYYFEHVNTLFDGFEEITMQVPQEMLMQHGFLNEVNEEDPHTEAGTTEENSNLLLFNVPSINSQNNVDQASTGFSKKIRKLARKKS